MQLAGIPTKSDHKSKICAIIRENVSSCFSKKNDLVSIISLKVKINNTENLTASFCRKHQQCCTKNYLRSSADNLPGNSTIADYFR